jgi:hypothetical protein
LAIASMPTAIVLATTTGRPIRPASTVISTVVPVREIRPFPPLNLTNRQAAAPTPLIVRSRHVQRSCQMKLWSTASSTDASVAGSQCHRPIEVSAASVAV